MKRFEAMSRLHRLLTARHARPLSLKRICEELECSESTAKRCIRDLRYRFDHPIVYDAEKGGYYYDVGDRTAAGYELPGLWFTCSELTALVTMRTLLERIQPGLFDRELVPLGRRVDAILERAGLRPSEVARRVRVLPMGRRAVSDLVFRCVADAVLERRRLAFQYLPRSNPGPPGAREVSPQRLVHYRDNWYLDAYCHTRQALRIFALDRIRSPRILRKRAKDLADEQLDRELGQSYGIFAGEPERTAVLRFTPRRAQWVAAEIWHPRQSGRFLPDGSWELCLPYAREEELLMDILKYGADVEVVAPASLRERVRRELLRAARNYGQAGGRRETA
ncbi:MAG: WYL domain-containing protein [Candidatus Dadabacteria bacterium]|nr:MAG: WYL domain-containing protein [Candidatus Dadabacteria bacterium]